MRNLVGAVMVIALGACRTSDNGLVSSPVRFQLAAPQVQLDSVLFQQSTSVAFELDHPGVEIRYTVGGAEVTANSERYTSPIMLDNSQFVFARAYHSEFAPSDMVRTEVRKVRDLSDASVSLSHEPDPRYAGQGPAGLVDRVKGGANFSSGTWMGFQLDQLRIVLDWDEDRQVASVTLSALRNHGSWIFLPTKIEVSVPGAPAIVVAYDPPSPTDNARSEYLTITLPQTVRAQSLELVIHPLEAIPDWHDGRGTTPWLFIDEVIIN